MKELRATTSTTPTRTVPALFGGAVDVGAWHVPALAIATVLRPQPPGIDGPSEVEHLGRFGLLELAFA